MITTPNSSAVNSGVPVGNVPADAGTRCFRPSDPAIASTGIIKKNRPTSIANAPVMLYHCVSPVRPPNADPLLLAWDVNAYVISVNPCGPGLPNELSAKPDTAEMPANARITTGTNRM